MTIPAWPTSFDQWSLPTSGSYTLSPVPDVRTSDYDTGPVVMRRRRKTLLHNVQFKIKFEPGDFFAFQQFYTDTIHHGVDKFTMNIWDGEVYQACTVRFNRPFQGNDYDPARMEIALDLVVLDMPIISEGAVYLIGLYGPDFVYAFALSIHELVHVEYPAALEGWPFGPAYVYMIYTYGGEFSYFSDYNLFLIVGYDF